MPGQECPRPTTSPIDGDELCDPLKHRVGLIAMSGVATIGQAEDLDWAAGLAGDRFGLGHGPVLIVETLNDENGAGNARQIFFDVPAAKIGMEPDIVPSPEGPGCIAVMAGELFGEIRGFERHLGLGDAFDAEVLDEDVRSKQHKAAHAVVNPRINQCDRGAVAVADENRRFNVELGEEFGESFEGFVVHEADGARFFEQVGVAGTVTGVDHRREPSGRCDPRRETLPVRD